MGKLARFLKIYWLLSRNSFLAYLHAKLAFGVFLSGKILRFTFFFVFLQFIVTGSQGLAGYSVDQATFFFVTYTLIDTLAQFLYREVYRFRPQVVSGSFDLTLARPFSALFRSLAGGADIVDLVTIPPLVYIASLIGSRLTPSSSNLVFYLILLVNGLLIATAFHIVVLALGIITLEIDHTVMVYRDLKSMGRFPVDIYKEPLKGILTYFIPIGLMITFPAKALMGLVRPVGVILAFAIGMVAIFASLKFWNYALKFYTSASS